MVAGSGATWVSRVRRSISAIVRGSIGVVELPDGLGPGDGLDDGGHRVAGDDPGGGSGGRAGEHQQDALGERGGRRSSWADSDSMARRSRSGSSVGSSPAERAR